MKIVTKLFIGFSLVIIIAALVGLLSIIQLRKIDRAEIILYEKYTNPLEILSHVIENFEVSSSNLIYCLYQKDTTDYLSISLDAYKKLENYISEYEKNVESTDTTENMSLYNEMLLRWGNNKRYFQTLLGFVNNSRFEEGLIYRENDKHIIRRAFRAATQNVIDYKVISSKRIFDNNVRLNRITTITIYSAIAFAILAALILGIWIIGSIRTGLYKLMTVTRLISEGNLENVIDVSSADEIGVLGNSVESMQTSLRIARDESSQQWMRKGLTRLNDVMRGVPDLSTFAYKVITELSTWLDAKIGAFYILSKEDGYEEYLLAGSYAYTKRKNLSNKFESGEGLVGQAAREKQQILLRNVPDDYIRITSGLGEAIPKFICLTPVVHENEVTAVLEIGTLEEISDKQLEFLKECTTSIAITIAAIKSREALERELLRSKELAEELQTQQEELKASNEELEEQTQLLRQSDERMKTQQEELRVANEELEEKNNSLQIQRNELTETRDELEIQAEELNIASKYKSEFLANMSHELRTPLNSLLILSKVLADNKKANLTKDQVESANIIYRSGNELLSLINEILDLSKIEAGQMDVNIEKSNIRKIADRIISDFKHVVEEKGLKLYVEIDKKAPEFIESDIRRLEQIIKNLTSNAIKFTRKGSVTICFKRPAPNVKLFRSGLSPDNCLAVSVTDTGIGIPHDKQKIIFEAFQQADGGTSRQYGGTGLGLSISRELAAMLGGEIQLFSEPGKGSEFTVYLPVKPSDVKTGIVDKQHSDDYPKKSSLKTHTKLLTQSVKDDREVLKEKNSNSILIIEDDGDFAKLLYDQSHEKGFKVLVALTGEEGIKLANEYIPAAVILDLHLPGISGWDVLEILKDNPSTRHIPVHIMSVDDPTIEVFRKGAIGYLVKPPKKEELDKAYSKIEEMISRPIKELLVVEDNKNACDAIVKLIGNGDVHSKTVSSGKNAIKELKSRKYDCVILDLGLPDMTGFELLKKLRESEINIPPVIVYTGKDLTLSEEISLREYAESIIIKGVKSEERLLDETSLFLHRMVEKFPEQKKKMILNLHDSDTMFRDKKVLIVDDDMRNVFALSKVLSDKGLKTIKAEDGMKALDILNKEPGIDLVIMDIMMPEMDGYETMKRIREQKKFAHLPIIALTAKAMKKDYEQCMAAGANDYMSKPVDTNRLISMLRIWLYR